MTKVPNSRSSKSSTSSKSKVGFFGESTFAGTPGLFDDSLAMAHAATAEKKNAAAKLIQALWWSHSLFAFVVDDEFEEWDCTDMHDMVWAHGLKIGENDPSYWSLLQHHVSYFPGLLVRSMVRYPEETMQRYMWFEVFDRDSNLSDAVKLALWRAAFKKFGDDLKWCATQDFFYEAEEAGFPLVKGVTTKYETPFMY